MQKPDTSKFMTIPREIRLQILEELLRSAGPLCKVSRVAAIRRSHPHDKGDIRYWRFELGGNLGLYPQIIACCQQLYNEGYPILYGNTVVVSLAAYGGFSPVDVLGYWRLEHVTGIIGRANTPILGRFQRIEFRLYIDFAYLVGVERDSISAINELCHTLDATGCCEFNHIAVNITDGSWQARFTRPESEWAEALIGLTKLSYNSCTLAGDIPTGVSTIQDIGRLYDRLMAQDSKSGIRPS